MQTRRNLIQRIDTYLKVTGKTDHALCVDAGVDHHVLRRLRAGEAISLSSIEKFEFVMDQCQLDPSEMTEPDSIRV